MPLAQYHWAASQVVAGYVNKTEGLVCSAIEAHEQSFQLLEALTKIFPLGAMPMGATPGGSRGRC